jgi:transposase InsO family protein
VPYPRPASAFTRRDRAPHRRPGSPHTEATAREGEDAARSLESAGGYVPPITGVLEQVQIDHTVVDLIGVDEHHRLPIGRPYVTVAIDVFSRCIVGLVIALEAPSALSVGLCLHTWSPTSGPGWSAWGSRWPGRWPASRASCI